MSDQEESYTSIPLIPEKTENPQLTALITLLKKLGMTTLVELFQDPELMEALASLRHLVPAREEETNEEHASDNDFGISLEQEFVIRDDKGETQAVLYFEELGADALLETQNVWIDSFSVAKALRRKGVGNRLMRKFLEKFGHTHTVYLRTRPYNDAPMSREQLTEFYQKWGFIELVAPTVMMRPPHPPRYTGDA